MTQPSSKPTEASTVAARLRTEIVEGRVVPGSRLKLEPLADRYEVSRGPLREAASRLASEGLLTFEDQRGYRVAPISRADLLDLTESRKRIELLTLRDAIAEGDLAWEGRVLAALHVLDRVTDHDGSAEARMVFAEHHRIFHDTLADACRWGYLRAFRDRLYGLADRYRHLAADRYVTGDTARDVAAEHRAIAEAAIARRADEACELLAAHLDETARALIDGYPEIFGDDA